MDIEFASSRMEKDLSNRRRITKQYGHIQTSLENRLSELWAANSLGDVTTAPPPRRHKLTGDRADCWGINVSKNWRIVLQPIGVFDPDDLHTITKVKIISIEDYH